jgi:hypothetical protein
MDHGFNLPCDNHMNHQVGAFCELIDFLYRNHSQWARNPRADQRQRRLNDEVNRSYNVVGERKLKTLLDATRKDGPISFQPGEDFLFLQPPDKEGALLPVLIIDGNFKISKLSIRMALFTFTETEELAAIGFRFETPHGEGRHNYHHVQMIQSFEKNTKGLPNVPRWLPVSQPAFMLSARGPITLFLGALMGLYGLGYLEHEWRGQPFVPHLKPNLDELKGGCGAPLTISPIALQKDS